jgi:DNA-binding transcriptional LysR family regulator
MTLAPPLATHLLMPDFADFARLHPDIEMEILSSGELANLTNREADVAIRVVYDRKTLPLNLHGLKGPELFGCVYMSRDRLAAWRAGAPDPIRWIVIRPPPPGPPRGCSRRHYAQAKRRTEQDRFCGYF